ncbi:hypothetical protein GH714_011301 [Hevea brasiliensis]|uniref:Pre-mRNA-splicing factor SLU7 n=1 Tax=Hevea brasiliensis TaxID=3981 RepID=A0A6A6L2C3_HEVBR|nr:hypothetical protein GH714_011301 [Hevea brasiliensis]
MATATVAFKSREDHRKQIELAEARKAGLAPAESLRHRRKRKSDPNYSKSWYDRGAKVYQAKSAGRVHVKNTSNYARVVESYEARDAARRKHLKEQQLKKLEGKNSNQNDEALASDENNYGDDLRVDEANVDDSKQMEACTNNWWWEHSDCQGDNQYRNGGQALEFKQLNIHAWEAVNKGQYIQIQAAPSQAELLYKNYKIIKEKLKTQTRDKIVEKVWQCCQ